LAVTKSDDSESPAEPRKPAGRDQCLAKAVECEEKAKRARNSEVVAHYRDLARQWRALAAHQAAKFGS
jgi:hypothetical protein